VGTALAGVTVVGLSILAALLGFLLVERRCARGRRQQHNDVAGFIYAVLGVIYAVLLAYVVIVVWQDFAAAHLTTEQEANQVADLHSLADELPAPFGARVRELARAYTRSVIDDEWPLLNRGQASPRTTELARDLGRALRAVEPQTSRDQVIYDKALTLYQGLQDNRRLRIYQSRDGLHPIVWTMLIGGAIITVTFTYLFGLDNTGAHALMIAALAAIIGAILFMIQATDYPYSGDVRVQPTPFELVLGTMDGP
jgi:Protein of unknown function (DUF4239)